MTQEIQTTDLISFTQEQVELIRSQIAPNAKPEELQLFLYQAKRSGLDPLSRQIYCIHRGGKMTIQTSIDGFRVIAERSGDYAGQGAPEFVTDEQGRLISCSLTVYRFKGQQRYPAAVGVAYMSEYNAGGPMWNKMPHTMLAKCAEAQALRKAYPQDLSGLYTNEEMEQTGKSESVQDVPHTEVLSADKTRYSTPEEIEVVLASLTTVKEVANLYYVNTELIEAMPGLKDKFSEKRNQIANPES